MSKQQMFQAEFINKQLGNLERQLRELDEKEHDLEALQHAVGEWEAVPEGSELRVPIARGIFVPATSTGKQGFFVNVGEGIVTEKSADKVREMLGQQLTELQQHKAQVRDAFEKGLKALQDMEREMR